MKHILLLPVFFLCCFATCLAQPIFYLGVEVGPKRDIYRFDDPGGQLSTKPVIHGPNILIKLACKLTPRYSVSSGVNFNSYGENFRLIVQYDPTGGSNSSMPVFGIPFRGHIKLVPWKKENPRLRIGGTAGYHLVFNKSYQSSSSIERRISGISQDIIFRSTTKNEKTKIFNLLEAGLFLDFELGPRWIIGFSTIYSQGFVDILESDISYSNNGGQTFESASAVSRSSYYVFHLGIQHRLGR